MIKAIVAADRAWNIGREGELLAHLPGDLRYFKEVTKGKTVVMGRATYESLPGQKPLPYRTNIVMTSRPQAFREKFDRQISMCKNSSVILVQNEDELWAEIESGTGETDGQGKAKERMCESREDVFVIGGGQIYRLLLPYCDEIYVTRLQAIFEADTTFPDLDADDTFTLVSESDRQEENGIPYLFTVYRRKK